MIPFLGYTPDLDPATPGAITDCVDILPTVKGMKGRPAPVNGGYAAFPSAVKGLAVLRILDGTRRVFAGTSSKLYELSGGVATDRSRGGGYTLGAESRWSFGQFGNTTLAAAKDNVIQSSSPGFAFADISGAPQAKFIATASGFVMAANTTDATYGDQSDRWRCSGFQDATAWTPSIATQSNTGRIVDSPGPITGLKALGDGFVLFKERAMWMGVYVGGDVVWQWNQISNEIGVADNGLAIDTGTAILFLGHDDFYLFDGTRPVAIGSAVREWFYSRVNVAFSYRIQGAYDRVNACVWWCYPSRSSTDGSLDEALVYHVKSNKWGKCSLRVEALAEYRSAGITWDQLGTLYATWNDLPTNIAYDSPYWSAEAPVLAYIDTTHTLQTLTGDATTSSITTGNMGDDAMFSTVIDVRPRFTRAPTSSTADHLYDDDYGDIMTTGAKSTLADGKYDFLWSSRWHRFRFNFVGNHEMIGFTPKIATDGEA